MDELASQPNPCEAWQRVTRELERERVQSQSIRDWLERAPEKAKDLYDHHAGAWQSLGQLTEISGAPYHMGEGRHLRGELTLRGDELRQLRELVRFATLIGRGLFPVGGLETGNAGGGRPRKDEMVFDFLRLRAEGVEAPRLFEILRDQHGSASIDSVRRLLVDRRRDLRRWLDQVDRSLQADSELSAPRGTALDRAVLEGLGRIPSLTKTPGVVFES